MLLDRLEINSATVPKVQWVRRGVENGDQRDFGLWLKATAQRPLLDNASYYPPPPVSGLRFMLNGSNTVINHGNWEFMPHAGATPSVLYLATAGPTTEVASASRTRKHLSVPQRALILLAVIELVEITDAPEGAVEEVQQLLLEKLTSKEQDGHRATVKRLHEPVTRTGIAGLGLAGEDLVILNSEHWFKADGAEVEKPTLRVQFS